MRPYEKTISAVRNALRQTFEATYPWFEKPEAIRSFRPADGGWTIDEILEHVTLTSHFLLITARNGFGKALKRAQKQSIRMAESDLRLLDAIGERGLFPWPRPEHMIPKGTPGVEVLKTMHAQEEECLDILERLSGGEGSLFKVRMSVNNTGHIDLYQWLYFIAQHAKRHIEQMEENLAEWQTLAGH